MFFVFFFFKQKTAYEMRISDWSSDVCSSDLPCVVKTSEQVRRTRTGCRQAHAQFASELGVGRRHKGRHLFMPDLHELKLVARTIKRTQQTIYAVSGIPEDAPHAPLVQTLPKEIPYGLRHCDFLPFR